MLGRAARARYRRRLNFLSRLDYSALSGKLHPDTSPGDSAFRYASISFPASRRNKYRYKERPNKV